MSKEHAALPWEIWKYGPPVDECMTWRIANGTFTQLALVLTDESGFDDKEAEANGKFIIATVNNHYRLIDKIRQATNQLAKIRDAEGCPPGHCNYQSKKTMSEIAGYLLDEFESLLREISGESSGEERRAS